MVYDGTTLKFYRNGILLSQIAATGNLIQNNWPTAIGLFSSQALATQFIGYINEVRIWNVARTQAQIQAYMNTSLPAPTTQIGLQAYYTFDDLINKQGNAAWNGTLRQTAVINQTNPTCAGFVADNFCCPVLQGTLTGSKTCKSAPGTLTFQSQSGLGPFILTYSDGTHTYTQNNVMDGVPFPVQVQAVITTIYTLTSIQDDANCPPTFLLPGITATIDPGICSCMADFSFTQNICNPEQVQFAGVPQQGVSYSWNIDGTDYTPANSADPTLLYTIPAYGIFPVTLKVTGLTCSNSVTKTIAIQVQPADIILTPDTPVCAGNPVPLKTRSALDFCWSPTTYLDNPASRNPIATPPVTTKYYFTAKTTGTNLIINGNFDAGNTGFTSSYTYTSNNLNAAEYFVGTNPNSWNPGMPACKDHTRGTGNMLLVNGSQATGVEVWSETLVIQPNTNYAFSTWLENISTLNPALLQFSINGQALGSPLTANVNSCQWDRFYTTWNSGNSTTAVISVINQNQGYSGNDFALDDMSFASLSLQMDSVTIDVETPSVTAGPLTSTVCPGVPVQLQAGGSLNYAWSPAAGLSDPAIADPVALPPSSTDYIVTGTSARGCIASDAITVNLFPRPLSASPDTTICLGDAARLNAAGALIYAWTPVQYLDDPASASPLARPDRTTRFYLSTKDLNQCTETDSVTVSIRPVPVFQAPPDEIVCKGFGVLMHSLNNGHYIYDWSPPTGLDDPSAPYPIAHPDDGTVYTLHISDSVCSGYESSFTVQVTVLPSPVITTEKDNDIDCTIHTAQLRSDGGISYSWTPATGLNDPLLPNPIASIDSTTTFIVKGTGDNGCYAFDTLTVKVTATGANTFIVPNAFTPNGDGHNDCFGVARWGDVQLEELVIFNRWGMRVFTTRNPSDCWDGTYKGKPQETGAYPYVIRAHSFCGEITRTGVVLLIR